MSLFSTLHGGAICYKQELEYSFRSVNNQKILKSRPKLRQQNLKKKPWGYWRNDSPPSLLDPLHYGPYRAGPYEDHLEERSMETKTPSIACRGAGKTKPSITCRTAGKTYSANICCYRNLFSTPLRVRCICLVMYFSMFKQASGYTR